MVEGFESDDGVLGGGEFVLAGILGGARFALGGARSGGVGGVGAIGGLPLGGFRHTTLLYHRCRAIVRGDDGKRLEIKGQLLVKSRERIPE